jgi:DNA-binding response OmpR family regulator
MDIQMPEMDGVTATKQIRSLDGSVGKIPIVAMTANAMQGDREKYLNAGLTAYISKPIDQRELLNTIAQLAEVEAPNFDESDQRLETQFHETGEPASTDATVELKELMSDLDNLLDGTR